MIEASLEQLGLDRKEAEAYMSLLKSGPNRPSTIAYMTGQPRTTTQNILIRLERNGLVTKSTTNNVSTYTPIHPDKLIHLVEIKRREKDEEYKRIISNLKSTIPDLKSMIGVSKRIPNVKYFQGIDAVRKVLYDTLTSKTDLKDFANIDAMFKHVKDINDEYVAEREKTKIKKRSLLLDTPFARSVYEGGEYSPKSHSGYKWIDRELYPFTLEMNIYDGKVSYLTYVGDDFAGVIIENEHIYQMHNSMWNLIWDTLPGNT
jgi:HTH-type transcriptional regulator, sugar sensing transcriptional regulator